MLLEDTPAKISEGDSSHTIGPLKAPMGVETQLLNPARPVSLCGLKRKNSKPTEQLEEEIRDLRQRVETLENELQSALNPKISVNDLEEDEEFNISDHDSSSYLNDSLQLRTKSGKLSMSTDIAYLYSVPLVREHNSKILSMGLPIDHNAEIDDII